MTLNLIAVFVRTAYFSARNNFGVAQQESNPQSATKRNAIRCSC